jgi:serine/threonine-protein kinase
MRPGDQVGQSKVFDIVERIGEGGMGKIYRAYDSSMDRYVALKVLKVDVPEAARERFRREAVIAANFSHPNLPRVLDRGEVPSRGIEWLTMEYLRGRDLGLIIDLGRRITLPLVIDIFSQTLDALEYIHARRIVHCDVKPDNIFVTRDPYDRRIVVVKLIDFGVSRSLDEPPLKKIIGDPRYMAPEQTVVGQPSDTRTDLYALGVTLFEALAGRHPFPGADEMSAHEMLQRQCNDPIPSLQGSVDLPPSVVEAIDEVVVTASAKKPALRYDDAATMKVALRRLLDLGVDPERPLSRDR